MLYLLCVITFGFVILNFKLNKKDWMAPAVILSAVFFLYTFGCVIEKNAYDIVFIPMTVFCNLCRNRRIYLDFRAN